MRAIKIRGPCKLVVFTAATNYSLLACNYWGTKSTSHLLKVIVFVHDFWTLCTCLRNVCMHIADIGRGPHTGSVQFIFWAELGYLSLSGLRSCLRLPPSMCKRCAVLHLKCIIGPFLSLHKRHDPFFHVVNRYTCLIIRGSIWFLWEFSSYLLSAFWTWFMRYNFRLYTHHLWFILLLEFQTWSCFFQCMKRQEKWQH